MLRKCFRDVDAKNNSWYSPKYYDSMSELLMPPVSKSKTALCGW